MKWSEIIIERLKNELIADTEFSDIYEKLESPRLNIRIHLAIFNEPFLSFLFNGQKTIESRFSKNNISPHGAVKAGDIVVLKKTGGDIKGILQVGRVIFSGPMNELTFDELKEKYSEGICSYIDPDFWETRSNANYATLFTVARLKRLSPFSIEKKDRRGWVNLTNTVSKKLALFD